MSEKKEQKSTISNGALVIGAGIGAGIVGYGLYKAFNTEGNTETQEPR